MGSCVSVMITDIFLVLTFLAVIHADGFGYEKMHIFGRGRVIPHYKHFIAKPYEYPAPLPARKATSIEKMHTPFQSLYQGVKREGNVRVYNKKFEYQPKPQGHLVKSRGDVPCKISYLAVETKGGIPVILSGGVGYAHFDVVVRARPYDPLIGRIRAWCNNVTMIYN